MLEYFYQKAHRVIDFIEKAPINFQIWLFSFSAILVARVLVENLLFLLKDRSSEALINSFFHNFLFFLILYWTMVIFLLKITKKCFWAVTNIVLWGYWIILFPPILDRLIFGKKEVWSFYYFAGPKELWDGFFSFFGKNLTVGVTLGTRIMISLAIFLIVFYVFLKTRNFFKTIFAFIFSYIIFFVAGSFPSFVAIGIKLFGGKNFFDINAIDVAGIFLVPVSYFSLKESVLANILVYRPNLVYFILLFVFLAVWQFFSNKEKFVSLLRNVRYPQMVFNCGLFLMGVGIGWHYFPQNFSYDFFSILIILNLLLAVFCAWFFSVFVNDFYDINIDKETNKWRPLITKTFSEKDYRDYALIFLFFSLAIPAVINIKIFLLFVCYHFFTTIYSAHPFRLKQFPVIASALSSFASLLFLVMGFLLLSTNQSLESFPFRLGILLFLGFTAIIPLKDLKDISGDRKDGVFTIPAIFGEEKSRIFIGSFLFLMYFFSVYILNEVELFPWALFIGAVSFWTVSSKKISIRSVNWWVLFLAMIYGILAVRIIFQN